MTTGAVEADMTWHRALVAISVILTCCLACTVDGLRQSGVSVAGGTCLLDSDAEDIVALAKELGVDHVDRITDFAISRRGCQAVIVRGDSSEIAPDHFRSKYLVVIRPNWEDCIETSDGGEVERGRWCTGQSGLRTRDTWLIRDGSWNSEVFLHEGVDHTVANRVIRALRKRTVDVAEGNEAVCKQLSAIDLKEVFEIRTVPENSSSLSPTEPTENSVGGRRVTVKHGFYRLRTGRYKFWGDVIQVKVVGDRVELLSVGPWL